MSYMFSSFMGLFRSRMLGETAGPTLRGESVCRSSSGSRTPAYRKLQTSALVTLLLITGSSSGGARSFASPESFPVHSDSSVVSCRAPDASSRVVCYSCAVRVDTLRLPDRNIFVGSERITVGDTPLPRGTYFLNCEKGVVFLSEPVPAGVEITVAYRFLPFYLRESYYLRLADSAAGHSTSEGGTSGPLLVRRQPQRTTTGLRLRGTKTFSVEIGSNREASLKQSLDMNVTGEISKGLHLTAVLTDRDLPIQPDGRTESVSQLDEIRVELRSKSFEASLGDCNFLLDGASLVSVSRKLEGAKVSGDLRGVDVVLAGSMLRGRWTRREFRGTEGKQGPYQLTTNTGAPCVVIGGTEKVWLDGVTLRRGESADYWIDYGSGKLYFTNRRPITGYSRIAVEYEFASGDYKKNFYAAGVGANLAGQAGRVEFLFVSEGDEKGPQAGALSQEEEMMLKELGDSPPGETLDGSLYVGPGNGDYELIHEDSTGVSFFKFAAEGGGAYLVSFVGVGAGNGAYFAAADTTGRVYYTYAGPGQAEYVPGKRLVAPASRRVQDIRATVSAGGFDVAAELALSQSDLNTFSSLDDDDNFGKAGIVALKSKARKLSVAGRSLGQLSVTGNLRMIDENFRTFGSINRAFDHENWAIADSASSAYGERRLELGTDYSPLKKLTFSVQHGELLSSSGLSARRNVYSSELSGRLSVSARLEKATSRASGPVQAGAARTVKSVGSRLTGWRVVPSLSYCSEVRENDDGTGRMADEVGGGLSSAWSIPLAVRIEERYRVEYLGTRSDRTRSYDALTHSVALEVSRWKSLSASCEYSVRNLNGYNGLESRRTELGKLFVSQKTGSGRLSYEVNHLVTTLHSRSSVRNIIYVGENQGHYDSTGTFRGRGDYEIEIIELDSSDLSADATTSAFLALRPFKGTEKEGAFAGILETLSSSSFLRSSGTLRGAGKLFPLLRNPVYTEISDAIRGNSLLREELEVASPTRTVAVRYRYEVSRTLNHQYQNMREKGSEVRQGIRLRSEPVDAVTLELEQLWRTKEREVEFEAGSSVTGKVTSAETALGLKYFPVRAVELGLHSSVAGFKDVDGGNSVTVSKLSPSATYGAGRSTRARLTLTLSSYSGDIGVLGVASSGAFVMPGRMEILFSLEHRAGQHLTISTRVSSRKTTDTFVTDGRVEMRAHF